MKIIKRFLDFLSQNNKREISKAGIVKAEICKLMPSYGGKIKDSEWDDESIKKFQIVTKTTISYKDGTSETECVGICILKCPESTLVFHTAEQMSRFFNDNEQLVKDYLMITENEK